MEICYNSNGGIENYIHMLQFKIILSWYWGMKHKITKCAVTRKEFVFFCLENASQHESL